VYYVRSERKETERGWSLDQMLCIDCETE
jgi:hypothetical protein